MSRNVFSLFLILLFTDPCLSSLSSIWAVTETWVSSTRCSENPTLLTAVILDTCINATCSTLDGLGTKTVCAPTFTPPSGSIYGVHSLGGDPDCKNPTSYVAVQATGKCITIDGEIPANYKASCETGSVIFASCTDNLCQNCPTLINQIGCQNGVSFVCSDSSRLSVNLFFLLLLAFFSRIFAMN